MEALTLAPRNSNLEAKGTSISFNNLPRVDDLNIPKITDLESTTDIPEASVLVERLEDMVRKKNGDRFSKSRSRTDAHQGKAPRKTTASSSSSPENPPVDELPSVSHEQSQSHQSLKRLAQGMASISSSVKRRRCSAPETKGSKNLQRRSRKNRSSSLTEIASGETSQKNKNVPNLSFKKMWKIVNPKESRSSSSSSTSSTSSSQEGRKHSHRKKNKRDREVKIVMEMPQAPACHHSRDMKQTVSEPDSTLDVPPAGVTSERVDLNRDSNLELVPFVLNRTGNTSCRMDNPSPMSIMITITQSDQNKENGSIFISPSLMGGGFRNAITAGPETPTCDPVREVSETSARDEPTGLVQEDGAGRNNERPVFDSEDSNTKSEDSNEDELTLRIDEDTKSECSEKSFDNSTEEIDSESIEVAEAGCEKNDPYRGPKKKYISKKIISTAPDSTNRHPSPISPRPPSRQAIQTHSSQKYLDGGDSDPANDPMLPKMYRGDSLDKTRQPAGNPNHAASGSDPSPRRRQEWVESDTTPLAKLKETRTTPGNSSSGRKKSQLESVDEPGEEKVSKKTRSSRRNFKHENISIMKPQTWEYKPALSIINSPKLLGALNAIEGDNNNNSNNDLNLITLHGVGQSSEEGNDTAILINYPPRATPRGEPDEEGAGKGTRRKGRSGRKLLAGAEDRESSVKSTPSGSVASEELSTKEEADSTVKLVPRKRRRGGKKQNADISVEEEVTLTRLENENRQKDARLAVDIPSHNWLAKKFKVTSALHEIDTNLKSSLNVSTASHRPEKTNDRERNLLPSKQTPIGLEEPLGDFDTEHRKLSQMIRRGPIIMPTRLNNSKGSPVPATLQPLELQNITSQLDLQVSMTEVPRGSPHQGQVQPQQRRVEQARPEEAQPYRGQLGETQLQVRQLEQVYQPRMEQILPREPPLPEKQAVPVKLAENETPNRDLTLEEQLEAASQLGQQYKQEQQRLKQFHARGHAGGMFYPHGRSGQHQLLPVRNSAQRLIPPAPASIPISFESSHGRQKAPRENAVAAQGIVGFFNPIQGPQDQVGRMTYLEYHVETEPISPKHQVEYPPFVEQSRSSPGWTTARDRRIGADVPDRSANLRQRQAYDDYRREELLAVARWHQEQLSSNRRPGEGSSGHNEGAAAALMSANDASRDNAGLSHMLQSQLNHLCVSYLVGILSQNASGQFDRGHYLNNGSISEGYAPTQTAPTSLPIQQALLQGQIDAVTSLINNNSSQQLSPKEIQLLFHELCRLNNLQAEQNRRSEQLAAQNWNTALALQHHVSPPNQEPLDQGVQAQPAVPSATSAATRVYANPTPPGASYHPVPVKPPTRRRTSRSSPGNVISPRPYATSTPRPMDLTVRRKVMPDNHGAVAVNSTVEPQQSPRAASSAASSPQPDMERRVMNINPNGLEHLIPTTSPVEIIFSNVVEPYGANRNGVAPPPTFPGGYDKQQSLSRGNSSQIIIRPPGFFSENFQRHHQMQPQRHHQMNAANQLYVQQRHWYQVPPPQFQVRYNGNQANVSHQRRPPNQPQNTNQGHFRQDQMTGTVQPFHQQHLPFPRRSRAGGQQEHLVFDPRQPQYMVRQRAPPPYPGDKRVARQNTTYGQVRVDPRHGYNPTQRPVAPNVCVGMLNNQLHGDLINNIKINVNQGPNQPQHYRQPIPIPMPPTMPPLNVNASNAISGRKRK